SEKAPAEEPPHWDTGIAGVAEGGIGPLLALGGALFVQRVPSTSHVFAPSFRVSLGAAATGGYSVPAQDAVGVVTTGPLKAQFLALEAKLDACPLRFTAATRVHLAPCLAFEALEVHSVASGVAHQNPEWNTRFAIDPLARFDVAFTESLFATLEAGLMLPFDATTEYVLNGQAGSAPSASVYRVPRVAPLVGAGLGLRFR